MTGLICRYDMVMKIKYLYRSLIFILFFCFMLHTKAQDSTKKVYHAWWNDAYPAQPAKNTKAKLLPLIHVY
jgi:hypothetical protein